MVLAWQRINSVIDFLPAKCKPSTSLIGEKSWVKFERAIWSNKDNKLPAKMFDISSYIRQNLCSIFHVKLH